MPLNTFAPTPLRIYHLTPRTPVPVFPQRILLYNPRSRLSATKALEHPYLAGIGTGTTLPLPPPYLNWNALGGDKRKAARRAAEQEAVILPAMVAEATNQDTVSASQQELGA